MDFNIPFYSREYWENYYKENGFEGYDDWYFDMQNIKFKRFNFNTLDKSNEIMIIGVGNSSLIDFLIDKSFQYVTLVDFSKTLIEHLRAKYENVKLCEDWDCKYQYFIIKFNVKMSAN
jgi:hypothetical protein